MWQLLLGLGRMAATGARSAGRFAGRAMRMAGRRRRIRRGIPQMFRRYSGGPRYRRSTSAGPRTSVFSYTAFRRGRRLKALKRLRGQPGVGYRRAGGQQQRLNYPAGSPPSNLRSAPSRNMGQQNPNPQSATLSNMGNYMGNALTGNILGVVAALVAMKWALMQDVDQLKQFDGRLSVAMANLQANRIQRQIAEARGLGDSGARFIQAIDKFERVFEPIKTEWFNRMLDLTTILVGMGAKALEAARVFAPAILTLDQAFWDSVKKSAEKIANDMGKSSGNPTQVPGAGIAPAQLAQAYNFLRQQQQPKVPNRPQPPKAKP